MQAWLAFQGARTWLTVSDLDRSGAFHRCLLLGPFLHEDAEGGPFGLDHMALGESSMPSS